jgi:tRNA (cytidine/uridine-2'-O-)-methyltransferase
MLHVVLFRPEIPQNCGNIGRLCAYTGTRLHLIRPLGFVISDKNLKRSGMDYWKDLDVCTHDDWNAFKAQPDAPQQRWLFTTHATTPYWDADFHDGDALIFGSESGGVPDWMHEEIGDAHRVTIPRFSENPLRSLNLATSVGIGLYEALRQVQSGRL